jgi:hypothetical protein
MGWKIEKYAPLDAFQQLNYWIDYPWPWQDLRKWPLWEELFQFLGIKEWDDLIPLKGSPMTQKKGFPLHPNLIFLNHGSFGVVPNCVLV